jgi:hypothetical protein
MKKIVQKTLEDTHEEHSKCMSSKKFLFLDHHKVMKVILLSIIVFSQSNILILKMNLESYLKPYIKINSSHFIKLSVKVRKLLKNM